MSWQQQQHYYGGSSSASAGKFTTTSSSSSSATSSQLGMEYNQDLHLKMSKKIAQLTKQKQEKATCQLEDFFVAMHSHGM